MSHSFSSSDNKLTSTEANRLQEIAPSVDDLSIRLGDKGDLLSTDINVILVRSDRLRGCGIVCSERGMAAVENQMTEGPSGVSICAIRMLFMYHAGVTIV